MVVVSQVPNGKLSSQKLGNEHDRYLAHELRSPIASVVSFMQILYSETEGEYSSLSDLERHILESIRRSGFRALDVIEYIYRLNELQMDRVALSPQVFDLRLFLQELYKDTRCMLLENPKLQYDIVLPSALPSVMADMDILRRALLNLLNNACRFTQQGRVALGACILDKVVCIYVQDSGLGIAEEDYEKIFEPYMKAAESEGSGFGLAFVREYARLMGGTIMLESEVGVGSTFYLALPILEAA